MKRNPVSDMSSRAFGLCQVQPGVPLFFFFLEKVWALLRRGILHSKRQPLVSVTRSWFSVTDGGWRITDSSWKEKRAHEKKLCYEKKTGHVIPNQVPGCPDRCVHHMNMNAKEMRCVSDAGGAARGHKCGGVPCGMEAWIACGTGQ